MKTKQLPSDFRDWISAQTFVIGVQKAIEPSPSQGAISDAGGDDNEDEPNEHRGGRSIRRYIDERQFFDRVWRDTPMD